MIFERFYPPVLKELVGNLRERNDLNEAPLKELDRRMLILFSLLIIPISIFIYEGYPFIAYLLLVLISWHSLYQEPYRVAHALLIPATIGYKSAGKIIHIEYTKYFFLSRYRFIGWNVEYSYYTRGGQEQKDVFAGGRKFLIQTPPRIGEMIEVRVHPAKEDCSIPDISEIRAHYCLSKKALYEKQQEHHGK